MNSNVKKTALYSINVTYINLNLFYLQINATIGKAHTVECVFMTTCVKRPPDLKRLLTIHF